MWAPACTRCMLRSAAFDSLASGNWVDQLRAARKHDPHELRLADRVPQRLPSRLPAERHNQLALLNNRVMRMPSVHKAAADLKGRTVY